MKGECPFRGTSKHAGQRSWGGALSFTGAPFTEGPPAVRFPLSAYAGTRCLAPPTRANLHYRLGWIGPGRPSPTRPGAPCSLASFPTQRLHNSAGSLRETLHCRCCIGLLPLAGLCRCELIAYVCCVVAWIERIEGPEILIFFLNFVSFLAVVVVALLGMHEDY